MSLRKGLTSILSRIWSSNHSVEKTWNETKKSIEEILEDGRNNFYNSLLKNIEELVETKYWLDKPNTHNKQPNNKNRPDDEDKILDSLEKWVMIFFIMIYINSAGIRDRKKVRNSDWTVKINEGLARKIFEKHWAYKNTLDIIQKSFWLTLQKIFSVKEEWFTSEERKNSKEDFNPKLIDILEFIKENSDWNILELIKRFDFKNIYCLENTNILMDIFFYWKNQKLEELIDKNIILDIIAIITYQLNISTLLSLTSKNTLTQANDYIALWINVNDYFDFIYYNWLLFDYLKIIESIISSNKTISKLPSKNELLKVFIEKSIKKEISWTEFSKFSKSWIYEYILTLDKNKKIFILKIIFSDINLFCKWWGFINKELFLLLTLIDEKRFEEILKLFEKWLKNEELKIIIENELEIFINSLLKWNTELLFKLLSLWININDLKKLWNEDFEFLNKLKINSTESFYKILEIRNKNPKKYKNIVLNSEIKEKVIYDLKLLSDTLWYDELLSYIEEKWYIEKEHDDVISHIRSLYIKFWFEKILREKRLEWNNKTHDLSDIDLEIMISKFGFNEEMVKIINRILSFLNKVNWEYFTLLWLLEKDVGTELLQKILNILSILKEFEIENYEIDKILENISDIDTDYLRLISENVKANNINWKIKELVLVYIYTLEKGDLNEYVRKNSEVEILVKTEMTELDDYLDWVIRSWNEDEIKKLWMLLEKMANNIFDAYDFRATTSTRWNFRFWSWSWSFVASTKSPIFWWLKKNLDEWYYDYLVRIEWITLIDLLPDEIKNDYYLNTTSILARNLGYMWLFAFLEIFSEDVIEKIRGKNNTDLIWLSEYYNLIIQEETSKLKKSLNI